ncbi:putative glycerol-3-phosphate transporter 3, partial [Diplonema papillatum]
MNPTMEQLRRLPTVPMPGGDRFEAAIAFACAWVLYVGLYLTRKNVSAVKMLLMQPRADGGANLTMQQLAAVDSAWLLLYTLGQVPAGMLVDAYGARTVLLLGSAGAAAAACAMSAPQDRYGSRELHGAALAALFAVNGLAQSAGWPACAKLVTEWFPESKGTAMGLWSTSYQVGGVAASALAGYVSVRWGWESSFSTPGVILLAVTLAAAAVLPAEPAAQLPLAVRSPWGEGEPSGPSLQVETEWPLKTEDAPAEDKDTLRPLPPLPPTAHGAVAAKQPSVLRSPLLWASAASYFFLKLIRYSLLFWLPLYLRQSFGMPDDTAAYVSTLFEIGGFFGVVVLGRLSDAAGGHHMLACSFS